MFAQTEKVFRGNIGDDDDDDDEHELIEANKTTNDQDGLEVSLYEDICHVSTSLSPNHRIWI